MQQHGQVPFVDRMKGKFNLTNFNFLSIKCIILIESVRNKISWLNVDRHLMKLINKVGVHHKSLNKAKIYDKISTTLKARKTQK